VRAANLQRVVGAGQFPRRRLLRLNPDLKPQLSRQQWLAKHRAGGEVLVSAGIGRQRGSTETGWLRGRIGKEGPTYPLLGLADVQHGPCDRAFPDGDFKNRIG